MGAILGTTLLGVAGATMTPKGRSLMGKVKDFIKWWIDELKKSTKKNDTTDTNGSQWTESTGV